MSELVKDICDRCSFLTDKIAATKATVQESSRRNREAREDLGDLSRQLSDLSDVLDLWKYDAVQNEAAKVAVSTVSPKLSRILQHCLEVLDDVNSFVADVEGLKTWSDHMKLEIDSLYKLLDVYTLSLNVTLEMLQLIADQPDDEDVEDTVEDSVEVDEAASGINDLNIGVYSSAALPQPASSKAQHSIRIIRILLRHQCLPYADVVENHSALASTLSQPYTPGYGSQELSVDTLHRNFPWPKDQNIDDKRFVEDLFEGSLGNDIDADEVW